MDDLGLARGTPLLAPRKFLDEAPSFVYIPPPMLVDSSLLRRAKIENVERLARSLGVSLPKRPRDGVYCSQLVSTVASKIRREAILDELKRMGRLGS